MFNLFNRNKKTYPKLKFGFRGENIEYATEIDSVEIGFTYIQGKRLYLDFTHWKSKRVISNHEKETILNKCLRHCNKNSFQKTIVVINSDVDKEFWLSICSKYKSEIKDIEFTSNDSQKKLLLEMFMGQIKLHGKVTINYVDYFTESDLIDYLKKQEGGT